MKALSFIREFFGGSRIGCLGAALGLFGMFGGVLRADVVDLTLAQAGQALAGQTVYAYKTDGTYLGVAKTTNSSGAASFDVSLAVPVKFRLDRNGTTVWSDPATATGAFVFAVPADTVLTATRDGVPLGNATVYVYNEAGTYTAYSRASDASGVARFSLASGARVKFRVDADGVQKFSAVQTAPVTFTFAVPGTMMVTLTKGGAVQANKTVYAYTEAGAYTGYSRTTDADGLARFCIDDGSVIKFRADDGSIQFYSAPATAPAATTFDLPADTTVTVTRDGQPIPNTTIYVYDEAGAYTGYSRTTDGSGVVRFSLAVGARIKFRADADGVQKYSSVQTAPATFTYALPGTTTLTLTKAGAAQANKTVYAYTAANAYTGYSRTTGADGVARFCIDDGTAVKFRADDGGIQFFSALVTAPTAAMFDLAADTVVTLTRDGGPLGNTTLYVYDEAGIYTGYSRTTDGSGVARFSLATDARVKFRADADGVQKFSVVQTAPVTFTFALPGTTTVTLTKGGAAQASRTVYAYTEAGVYTGYSRTTDANGIARFCIDDGSVIKFRADDGGVQFFSSVATAPAATTFDLSNDTVVSVTRDGAPLTNTTVYAYDEAGAYTGYSRTSDAMGVARFSLAAGMKVKFRVDADGVQKYSAVQSAPVTFTFALPGTMTVTLTKGGVVQTNKTVYAYTEAGAYTGYSRTTDASGAAHFCIDDGSTIKFRADDGGVQFFSALATAPSATTFDLPADTVVTVTRDGAPLGNLTVYVYDEAGAYTGYSRTSDATGVTRFSIAAGTKVKFRADADGVQKYSAAQSAPVTFTFALPGTTTVTLTKGGVVQTNKTVYGYTEAGAYTGYSRTTDASGVARFCIDDGSAIKFRADDGGVQFFSALATAPHATTFDLPADTVITVTRDGAALGNTTVYAYDEAGAYTGYSRTTDAGGVAHFSIAVGTRVKFRVDADGVQKYSPVQTAPATFVYALPGTTTVALTNNGVPQANKTVYVYTVAGAYSGYSRTTGGDGLARFCIDEGTRVKFRADDGGAQHFSDAVTAPAQVPFELNPNADPSPDLTSATLQPQNFERGVGFQLVVVGNRIASGAVAVDFLTSQGGQTVTLPLTPAGATWVATGTTPGNVPLPAGGATSISIAATISLQSATGKMKTDTVAFTLLNDTNPPAITVDQPTTAQYDAAATTITGNVSRDATELRLVTSSPPGTSVAFDPSTGRFSVVLPLQEGPNTFTLVARDFVGNQAQVALAFTRTLMPPVIAFTSPVSFTDSVNTTTIRLAGSVTDASAVTLTLNGALVPLGVGGVFDQLHSLTSEGANTLTFVAEDAFHQKTTLTKTVDRVTQAPALTITFPTSDPFVTRLPSIQLAGTVGSGATQLLVNQSPVSGFSSGTFSQPITLVPGNNIVAVEVRDALGNARTLQRTIVLDQTPSTFVGLTPASGFVTNIATVTMAGRVVDGQTLTINGSNVALAADGSFSKAITLAEGPATISLEAKDAAGNSFVQTVTGELDTIAPVVSISSPASGVTLAAATVNVIGAVDDPTAILTLNSTPITNTAGAFNSAFPLTAADTTIVVQARDAAGNSGSKTILVHRDSTPPAIAFTAPANGAATRAAVVRVAGTVDDPSASVAINGRAATVANGQFEIVDFPLVEGQNVLTAVATDGLGNTSAPLSLIVTSDRSAPATPVLAASRSYIKTDRLTVQGTAEAGSTVTISGGLAPVSATADSSGAFSAQVLVNTNKTTVLLVRALDGVGNESDPFALTVVSDTVAPVIALIRPAAGASLHTSAVEVFGTVADANPGSTITVNGQAVVLATTGQFGCRLTLPDGAAQSIVVATTDLAGNQAQLTRSVDVANAPGDEDPPSIAVLTPAYDALVPAPQITVTALVTDESPLASLTIGGVSAALPGADGRVSATVTVDASGEFTIVATDAQNLTTTVTHRVQVDGSLPAAPLIQGITPNSPTAENQVVLYGTAVAGLRYEIVGGLLDKQSGVVGADGKFTATVPLVRNTINHLLVTAVGANGLSSPPATSNVIQDSIAPTIDHTLPSASSNGVPLAASIQIFFSEAIKSTELPNVQVKVGSSAVAVTRSLSGDAKTLTLTPSAAFSQSSTVTVTVPAALSDLAGNTLGSSYTFSYRTLDQTPPVAAAVDPLPAATNQRSVTVTGSGEAFGQVTISGGAEPITANVDAAGHFQISVTLNPNATNTLQVIVVDAAGNASPPSTITIAHNDQSLVLQSSSPADGAVNVAVNTTLSLTFNKPVDPASLTGVALVGQGVVPSTVTANANVISLTPSAALMAASHYEIVIPASVADSLGNRLGTTRRIAFTTLGSEKIAAPIVYTARPTGVTNLTSANLTGFSTPGTQLLVSGGAAPFTFPASGTLDSTGLFTLDVPLQLDTQNTLVVRARDSQGRESDPVTALDLRQDAIAPTVINTLPANGATNVDPHDGVFVAFSEAIQAVPLTASIPAIRLFDAQNVVIAGSWILANDARSATFYPASELVANAPFKLLIGTAVRDLAGNALATATEVDFTTGATTAAERPSTPVLDPLPSTRTTADTITLTGSATAGAQLRVFGGQGGVSATVDANGRFTIAVPLVTGAENSLAVVAEVNGLLSTPATLKIVQAKHAAGFRILSPQPDLTYNNRSLTVAGVIDEPDLISGITVAANKAAIVGRFFFCQVILDEAPGAKSVTAVASLKDGSSLQASVSFSLLVEPTGIDTKPPIPRFMFPEEGDVLAGEVVETLLTVEEGVQLSTVEIDHVVAHQVVGNIFFIYARLPQQGANAITVTATDAAGLVGTATVNVVADSIGFAAAPVVTSAPSLTNDRVVTLTGTAEPGSTIVVLNGLVPVRTVVSPDGTYSVDVPLNPNAANHLQVVATDAAGNLSPVTALDIVHDDTRPVIVSFSPANGQTGIAQNAVIEVTFSEPLNPDSVTADGAVVLHSTLGQAIQRNVLLSADGKTIRIVPAYKFLRGDTITADLSAGIADTHGFSVGSAHSFSFTTAAHRTTVSGIVVDPELHPLANVRVGILGTSLVQTTSSFGTFLLDDAPVGDQILYVDARPDPATGLSPQGDARVFNYLEFFLPVRQDADNSLGRPIFLVDTDLSTASTLALTGEDNVLTFTPAQKDLAGFSLTYRGGSARFADGTQRGKLTATRIDAANIPERLPSGAIPHFLVEIGPDGLTFDTPARLSFPNVYDLPIGAEVIVFHFKYGVHNYAVLGRATVGADHLIHTDPLLTQAGFVGIVPADNSFDLTRTYLEGRVVDATGAGLAGVSVNAIAGSTSVVTDASGKYSIPMPEVRLELVRTFATVSTDLGSHNGESPSLVFQSELVTVNPSGVTQIPDIVVDSFFLGGSIRYVDAAGARIPVTGLAYNDAGQLVSVDDATARGVQIFVYRRIGAPGDIPAYDSEPYLRTAANLDRLDDQFDASFSLSFLGSLADAAAPPSAGSTSQTPKPGDVVKVVAFDPKTGFYGETDLKIPAAADANGGDTPLDVIADLELRPPVVTLDMNRVFFLDGIRRRANIPHRGIAFTNDEYVEFKTAWTTPAATPLDRPELALTGRLRVNSIDYQTDYGFTVRGGEHFRVLELREALVPNRLSILQRETDVGIETVSVSRDGSFADTSLVPIAVKTDSYGLAQASADVAETSSKNVQLNILNLAFTQRDDGLDVSGRTLPGKTLNVAGVTFAADGKGYFGRHISGALGTGGISVAVGDSLTTRYGEALTPVINALNVTPAGLVPSRGGQGDRVLINGAHFSPVPTDNKVDFNGAVAVVQSATENQLAVLVPNLASSGDVTVTIAGKKSNGVRFDFLSVGINNGSFEDGTLRGYDVEGSTRVVEQWKHVLPTDRQYMAFLDTMDNPRDGVSTLTTQEFEVPAGMQTLLFDYNFLATALLHPASDCLEFYIITDSATIKVAELFAAMTTEINAPISGFDEGTGFRTAGILVSQWAGTGARIQVRVVLKGRGALPDFIPGMNPDDHNPIGLGNNPGTGLLLDNFRLSSGYEVALPAIDPATLVLVSNGDTATITSPNASLPPSSRVYIWEIGPGNLHQIDVGADGRFSLTVPFSEDDVSADFLISYATPAPLGGPGRMFSLQIKLRVDR